MNVLARPRIWRLNTSFPTLTKQRVRFVAQCPFVIVATADAQGRCDASPKGDPPGFLHIADERTLYLPDRSGNKMSEHDEHHAKSHVGMILIIPGEEWTMRINGQARVVDDPPLLERLSARGHPAQLAIEIKRGGVFFPSAPGRSNVLSCGTLNVFRNTRGMRGERS